MNKHFSWCVDRLTKTAYWSSLLYFTLHLHEKNNNFCFYIVSLVAFHVPKYREGEKKMWTVSDIILRWWHFKKLWRSWRIKRCKYCTNIFLKPKLNVFTLNRDFSNHTHRFMKFLILCETQRNIFGIKTTSDRAETKNTDTSYIPAFLKIFLHHGFSSELDL